MWGKLLLNARANNSGLKYQNITPTGCKDKGISKFEVVLWIWIIPVQWFIKLVYKLLFSVIMFFYLLSLTLHYQVKLNKIDKDITYDSPFIKQYCVTLSAIPPL